VEIFISHRTDDNGCGNVNRFKEDLEDQLRREGLHDPHAFLSITDLASGVVWKAELRDRLNAAQVFLPLLSPGYFMSDVCSKEWNFFERRMSGHAFAKGLVQPVLWSPSGLVELPDKLLEDGFKIGGFEFGDKYEKPGLQRLMHADPRTYEDVVRELAREIVRRLDEDDLDLTTTLADSFDDWQPKFQARALPSTLRVLVLHSARATKGQIDRFAKDLESFLAFVGHPGSEITVIDVDDLTAGDEWRPKWEKDLRSCHVFVPVLSRNFGLSATAARAWGLMERRMTEDRRGGGKRFVMPILWSPAKQISILKQVGAVYQLGNGKDERTYVEYGLLHLLDDPGRFPGEYEMQMWRFAEGIAATFPADGQPDDLMPEGPRSSFAATAMFFEPRRARKRRSPRPVGIVRVAAHLGELRPNDFGHRIEPDRYYGPERDGWHPYNDLDGDETRVIDLAKRAVGDAERKDDGARMADAQHVLEIDDIGAVPVILAELGQRAPIVILDVFMIGSKVRRDALLKFLEESARLGTSCEMFVPNNENDPQTADLVGSGFSIVGPRGRRASFTSVAEWIGAGHRVETPENNRKLYDLVRDAATLTGPLSNV
jgi:hypothetical protein